MPAGWKDYTRYYPGSCHCERPVDMHKVGDIGYWSIRIKALVICAFAAIVAREDRN